MAVRALADVASSLRCPVCSAAVHVDSAQVSCEHGHRFDIARQGYVTLTGGRGGPGTGDSAAMVLAREEFLGGGYYQPLADALAGLAARLRPAAAPAWWSTWPAAPATTSPACSTRCRNATACASTGPPPRCAAPPGPTPGRSPWAPTRGSRCRWPTPRRRWC